MAIVPRDHWLEELVLYVSHALYVRLIEVKRIGVLWQTSSDPSHNKKPKFYIYKIFAE